MSERTGIAWTKSTFNPWIGCRRVSPGCAKCYADRLVTGLMGGDFSKVRRTSEAKWREPLSWEKRAAATGEFWPVFSASLSDIFIEEADKWRDDFWNLVKSTPHLTYQILTKRPERVRESLPSDWGTGYPNVWLGASVEDQAHAGRLDTLNEIEAAIRFVSVEPMLGPVDIFDRLGEAYLSERTCWVIAGGESGPGARPCDEDWLRDLRNQANRSGAAFFLKQLGGHPDKRAHEKAVLDGRAWTEMPNPPLTRTEDEG